MHNPGVTCDVSECTNYEDSKKCKLSNVEITHQKMGNAPVSTPHFCKSYCKK